MSNMQDNALHGWRLKELGKPNGELRMAGYPNKIPAMAFSAKGKWLVTAGTEQIICWPFFGGGPSGRPPLALGVPENSVSMIAPHPSDDMCAAGYTSGRVIMALYEDRLPIEILRAEGNPITTLAWNQKGDKLLVGREDGQLYLYTSASIIAASQA
jgi:WD40 repeat protein